MRRPNFDFDMIGVPIGATLTFRGREHIACIVVKQVPPLVVYPAKKDGGEVVSLTRATKMVTGKTPEIASSWAYKGELLSKRRKRLDAGHLELE